MNASCISFSNMTLACVSGGTWIYNGTQI
jgi:hypothetical protein